MEEEDEVKCDCPAGIPAWVMTFADLMSLLMCFFVLLLSFAEMDIQKFKQVKGSLTEAFGVQREVSASEIPKGTSLIADEFSSAAPDRTLVNEVRQVTTDDKKQTLEFTDALEKSSGEGENSQQNQGEVSEETAKDSLKLQAALSEEIDKGLVEIETQQGAIIIRISEKASFPSGAAKIRNGFIPVLEKLRQALSEVNGKVVVAGHTDNRPIKTARFRSNWELSASRAVSVVHELLAEKIIPRERFIVEGHGDAHPIVDNDSSESRAKNRRVELTIVQDNDANVEQQMDVISGSEGGSDQEIEQPGAETSEPTDPDPLDELTVG
ncbi:MAG: type VI secretion system protein TssL, long form [Gammaproteobacteria bacterium]